MFTIGTDPEFILCQGKKPISAIGKFPHETKPLKKNNNKFFYDNVMVEIQIKQAKSKKDFIENIKTAIYDLVVLSKPYSISNFSSITFPDSELTNSESRVIGCNVDYCAYELKAISQPKKIIKHTGFRTAGGHIHLGSKFLYENPYDFIHAVKMLDLFLCVPSLLIDQTNGAKKRRIIYGKAGSHRATDYGLEYRPLSNFWLFSPSLCSWVYDICEFVMNFIQSKKHLLFWKIDDKKISSNNPKKAYKCTGYDVKKLRQTINDSNLDDTHHFLRIIKEHLPSHLYNEIFKFKKSKFNIVKNWEL